MIKKLIGTLVISFLILCSWNQNVKSENTVQTGIDFSKSVETILDEKIPEWQRQYNVPCVGIGIIEDGNIKYIKVFGELKKGVPAPDNAIFAVASMTKPVVAMLTLQLVEDGQWDLDEPLFHYWIDPDVANDPLHKKLTTRHVLSHQTGFPNWRKGKLTFEFEPGTDYQYSGEGFVYLARALEQKFNKSLEQLSDSVLFKPIGMKDTRYCWDKNVDESRFAFGHGSGGNIYSPSTSVGVGAGAAGAAGSLLTTLEDYCKFAIYVINGAGLSPKIYNDMITSHVHVNTYIGRGLGWEIVSDLPNGEYSLQHGGSNVGVKTMGILLPKSKRAVIVFTNGDNGMFVYHNVIKESIDIGENILDSIKGGPDTRTIVQLSDEILERYVGNYLDSGGRNLTIRKEGRTLTCSGEGLPTVHFFPEAENTFFLKDLNVQFEFIDDDSFNVIEDGKIGWTAKKVGSQEQCETERLIVAAGFGHVARLQRCLAEGVDSNTANTYGITPLHWAQIHGQLHAEQVLLEHGAVTDIPMPSQERMVDSLFDSVIDKKSAGGAVLVAKDGKILLSKGYGYADVEANIPFQPDTKFRIASMTKQFTAAAILKLQGQGKLSVNDTLSKYMPDFPRAEQVTIEHLATHTSGIYNYTRSEEAVMEDLSSRPVTADELIDVFRNAPYDFDPGQKHQYSNSGYVLLAKIIEMVSGTSYADFLTNEFFVPLGMTDTRIHNRDALMGKEAVGYTVDNGMFEKVSNWYMEWAMGAGNISSTADDLFLWNEALYTGHILDQHTLQVALTPAPASLESSETRGESGYGYGLNISSFRGLQTISHGGGMRGFTSEMVRYPQQNLTIVILINTAPPPNGLEPPHLAEEIAQIYLWEEMNAR